MRYLAVDLGASSGRTMLGIVEKGKIRLEETHRFENRMSETRGSKRWDVQELLAQVKKGIAASGKVHSLGLDTWGVDYGLLDADGKLLAPPFAYRDRRTEAAIPEVFKRVPPAQLYRITGLQHMPFNTIYQLMADKLQQPEVFAKAAAVQMLPSLLTYLLTGVKTWEYTMCSTSGLLDARRRTWSPRLLKVLGFPAHLFGDIVMPGAPAGEYQGIPVCLPAMHDTGSAVAAVPGGRGSWAYLSSGTWSLIGVELPEPNLTRAAAAANFTNEGGVGGQIRFLKIVNGLWLIQECRRQWLAQGRKLSFGELDAAAAKSSYAGTINPSDPRFLAPVDMVQEITAALAETGQAAPANAGDYARCCYLSLAQAYREQLGVLARLTGRTFSRVHIVGGGSQAELLNQLTADALGLPVSAGPVEATALGNIGVQAMAKGQFRSVAAFRRAIGEAFPVKEYRPRRDKR